MPGSPLFVTAIEVGDIVRVKEDRLDWGEGKVTDRDDAPYVAVNGVPVLIVHFLKRNLQAPADKFELVRKGY